MPSTPGRSEVEAVLALSIVVGVTEAIGTIGLLAPAPTVLDLAGAGILAWWVGTRTMAAPPAGTPERTGPPAPGGLGRTRSDPAGSLVRVELVTDPKPPHAPQLKLWTYRLQGHLDPATCPKVPVPAAPDPGGT
jgi:hypothetical protein